MEIKATLEAPYTEEQKEDFIIEYNYNLNYEIRGAQPNTLTAWGYTEEEQQEQRKERFNKDFFNTSLGYIRRKVSMATGEIKDFLSDLLPTISMGLSSGATIPIIAYNEPDFTQEEIDWESLQHNEVVTAQFIQECFQQLSNDFRS